MRAWRRSTPATPRGSSSRRALVLLMTPALALFYGGMVRRKNVLSTIMHSLAAIPILSVAWALFGYSLAFGPTHHGLIGGLELRRAERARGRGARHRPDARVRRLPDDVRGHHARAHLGRLRRAHEVQRVRGVHPPLVDARLRSGRALGVGRRRVALQAGRARLRGRHGRPPHRRRLGARLRARHRQARSGTRSTGRCRTTSR